MENYLPPQTTRLPAPGNIRSLTHASHRYGFGIQFVSCCRIYLKGKIMIQNLTQPEEIDLVLKEMEINELTEQRQITDDLLLTDAIPKNWNSGYISPYRAAYMKIHGSDRQ